MIASAAGVPADQVEVIYNGAATSADRDFPSVAARRAVRAELGIDQDAKLLISVGRLHEQKGQRDLIAACRPLFDVSSGPHLLIAGEGAEERALRSQAEAAGIAGNVHLLGRRNDVRRLLGASDVFAFASRFEGLPFAVVEAMSAGLPIVSTGFPGVEEIVRHGQDGLVVPVGDVPAMTATLHQLLNDAATRKRMGESARARAEAFSEREMLDQTFRLLTSMAATKPGRSRTLSARGRRVWR